MAKYDALAALPGGEPGPWGEPVTINYDQLRKWLLSNYLKSMLADSLSICK